jgi:Amt family ammonium transporter
VAAVGAYAFAVTYGIGRALERAVGFRASEEEERTGLDLTLHAETAYDHGVLTHGTAHGALHAGHPGAVRPAPPAPDRSPFA